MIWRSIRQTFIHWQRLAAVLLVLSLFSAPAAQAAIQEYSVVAAGVDHSSIVASAKAMDYAKKRAVYLAARKLGVTNASNIVARLPPEAMAQIIRGATIIQTKREGEVTYAEVSVSIVVEALRRALKLPDAAPANGLGTRTRGLLLLCAYVTPTRTYMWENENILREPLSDEIQRQAHGTVMLSGGDFDDLRLVDYNNAMKVTAEELKPMFERYGAQEIVIAFMTPGTEDTTEPSTILLRRLNPAGTRSEVMQITPTGAREPLASRIAHAASAIAAAATQIASSTSEEDRAKLDKATKVTIHFAYTTPQRLATMQEAVRTAPHVLLLELPAIALNDVAGTVYLDGDPKDLQAWLVKQGIAIVPAKDGWRATLR